MRWNNWVLKWALAALAATGQWAAAQQAPPAPAPPAARFVVVLDAAHGGDDPGGRLSNGQLEKTFTLTLSVRLRSLLAARGIQTAQACLSLHASGSGSGVHLFISSLAPAEPARMAAWKTAQSAWVTRSLALAGTLNSALLHAGMNVTLGRAALPAIDSMTCPAVAVEIAPERDSGHQIIAALDDPGYQARVAEALAAALLEWRTEAHP
ncbi:MAG: N-acetylmuramoyl-L-alanine amidase [Terracidiphilus sp.]